MKNIRFHFEYIILILAFVCLFSGTTFLSAIHEKNDYKDINNEIGMSLFHSNYYLKSIDDIYTSDEAIIKLKELQNFMRKIPCTYYVYSDTAIGDIDKIQAINQSLIDHEFAKNILKEGQMLNGTYHIKDMDHIHIPALITDTTSKYHTVGSKVECELNNKKITFDIIGKIPDIYVKSIDCYLNGLVIPELYFDVEPQNEEDSYFQEWVLSNLSLIGYVVYNSASEYYKANDYISNICNRLSLEWTLEPKEENRYAGINIPITNHAAILLIVSGCLLLIGLLIIEIKPLRNTTILIEPDRLMKRIILKDLYIIIIFLITYFVFFALFRDRVYLKNLRTEKGTVLFLTVLYLAISNIVKKYIVRRNHQNEHTAAGN